MYNHNLEDVPLVQFMYFVFTCMPGESYHRCLGSFVLIYFKRQLTPLCVDYHFLKPVGIQGIDQPTVDDQVQSE